jgi:hypothetical protein
MFTSATECAAMLTPYIPCKCCRSSGNALGAQRGEGHPQTASTRRTRPFAASTMPASQVDLVCVYV